MTDLGLAPPSCLAVRQSLEAIIVCGAARFGTYDFYADPLGGGR